jgi:hypothetical protein
LRNKCSLTIAGNEAASCAGVRLLTALEELEAGTLAAWGTGRVGRAGAGITGTLAAGITGGEGKERDAIWEK